MRKLKNEFTANFLLDKNKGTLQFLFHTHSVNQVNRFAKSSRKIAKCPLDGELVVLDYYYINWLSMSPIIIIACCSMHD